MQRAAIQLCLVAVPASRRAVALVARVHRTHGRPATRVGRGRRRWLQASRPSPSRHGGFGRDPRRRRVYYYYYLHGASPAKAHLQAAPALNTPSRPSSRGDISDIYVVGVSGLAAAWNWKAPGPGLTCPPRRAALAPRVRSRSSPMDTASPPPPP